MDPHRHTTIYKPGDANYPPELAALKTKPVMYLRGRPLPDIMSQPRVAIVGSRTPTAYGKQVTYDFAKQLAQLGVIIVSGLAYGVDAIAHQAALEAGGTTVAILPTPVQTPAPAGNIRLADNILQQGGALISSYPYGSEPHKGNFVERNEYVAALSQLVLITEAAKGSGSLHTARFKIDSGDVLVIPGSITSPMSAGSNTLLVSGLAGAVQSVNDITNRLGLGTQLRLAVPPSDNPHEQRLLQLLFDGITDGQQLYERSGQSVSIYNQTLTMLEISGKIRPLGANHWALA